MTAWKYRVKLSKGSLLLLYLALKGHVWRDGKHWVASTERNKRNVDLRVTKLIDQGMLSATYKDNFPKVTQLGMDYMKDHPLQGVLQTLIR